MQASYLLSEDQLEQEETTRKLRASYLATEEQQQQEDNILHDIYILPTEKQDQEQERRNIGHFHREENIEQREQMSFSKLAKFVKVTYKPRWQIGHESEHSRTITTIPECEDTKHQPQESLRPQKTSFPVHYNKVQCITSNPERENTRHKAKKGDLKSQHEIIDLEADAEAKYQILKICDRKLPDPAKEFEDQAPNVCTSNRSDGLKNIELFLAVQKSWTHNENKLRKKGINKNDREGYKTGKKVKIEVVSKKVTAEEIDEIEELNTLIREAKRKIETKNLREAPSGKGHNPRSAIDEIRKTRKMNQKLGWVSTSMSIESRLMSKLNNSRKFSNLSNRVDKRKKSKKWEAEIVTMKNIPIPKSCFISGLTHK